MIAFPVVAWGATFAHRVYLIENKYERKNTSSTENNQLFQITTGIWYHRKERGKSQKLYF